MFDIAFTGETVDSEGEILHLGRITLGEATEGFSASVSFWSREDYQKQWLEAAKRLIEPDSHSAFVTCMYDPQTAAFIDWWPAWRTTGLVVLQNQLLFIGAQEGDENYLSSVAQFSAANPYAAVMDWDSTHCEECRRTSVCRRPRLGKPLPDTSIDLCPSEWCVQLQEVQGFIERMARSDRG